MKKVTVALAAALMALAAATAQGSSAARAATTATPAVFTDPAGDSGTAPDVTQVSVNNDQTGKYEFDVSFATDYGASGQFFLYVDSDKNVNTGDPDQLGADYVIFDDHATHEFEVDAWSTSANDWTRSADKTAEFTVGRDLRSAQVSINESELGNTTDFNFFVVSADGANDSDTGYDDAPSGSGSFAYTFQQEQLKLTFVTTKSVIVGRAWTVAAAVNRSDTNQLQGSSGTIACHSKLAVTLHTWVSPGGTTSAAAVCQFKLPKKTKKKVTYTATITVTADGATVTKPVSVKA